MNSQEHWDLEHLISEYGKAMKEAGRTQPPPKTITIADRNGQRANVACAGLRTMNEARQIIIETLDPKSCELWGKIMDALNAQERKSWCSRLFNL